MDTCSICKAAVDAENAPILAMGGFGNPRYLCEECQGDFDELTLSKDTEAIRLAGERIGKKMAASGVDDKLTLKTVEEVMRTAGERKEQIEKGIYDFSEEEAEQNCDDTVPEELLESEEESEEDIKRAQKYAKIDMVSNWICIALIAVALGFFVYKMFF